MNIRILQSNVGCYNFCNPKQETFSFGLGLVDDNNKVIEVNGIKAVLHFSGEPDEECYFENPLENLYDVYEKCTKYANSVWSSTNYKAQCLLFAKLYQENLESLDAAVVKKNKETVQNKIDDLQKELKKDSILPDLTDVINEMINKKIADINKSIAYQEKQISELKEDSESYKKAQKQIDDYLTDIEKLKQHLINEE